MERPTLRQLEILAEVARAGTFRGAARNLGLSQVAVSDHVKQLENRLGCALFVRNAGGKPTLSASGKIVLDHGRNVLFACDALISAARSASADQPVAPLLEVEQEAAVSSPVAAAPMMAEPIVLEYAPDLTVEPEIVAAESAGAPDVAAQAELEAPLPDPEFEPVPAPVTAIADELAESDTMAAFYADHAETGHSTAPLPDVPKPPAPVEEALKDAAAVEAAPVAFKPLLHRVTEETPEVPNEKQPDESEADKETPIRLASHPAILSRFQDKLAAAEEAFPDRPISVDFGCYTPDQVMRAFHRDQADVALFYALGEVPGLPSDYLWSERWSLFAREDHPLVAEEAVHFYDCVDMPVVLFDPANPLRTFAEICLAEASLWPTPTVLETDDFAAIAAELDYGEAVFPAFGVTAAQFAARPGLKRIALVEPLRAVHVRRAIAPPAEDDPTIAALAGLLG